MKSKLLVGRGFERERRSDLTSRLHGDEAAAPAPLGLVSPRRMCDLVSFLSDQRHACEALLVLLVRVRAVVAPYSITITRLLLSP